MSESALHLLNSSFVSMLFVCRGGSGVGLYVGKWAGGGVGRRKRQGDGSQRLGKTRPLTQPPPAAAAITHKRFSSYCCRRRFCRGHGNTTSKGPKQQRHTKRYGVLAVGQCFHDALGFSQTPTHCRLSLWPPTHHNHEAAYQAQAQIMPVFVAGVELWAKENKSHVTVASLVLLRLP